MQSFSLRLCRMSVANKGDQLMPHQNMQKLAREISMRTLLNSHAAHAHCLIYRSIPAEKHCIEKQEQRASTQSFSIRSCSACTFQNVRLHAANTNTNEQPRKISMRSVLLRKCRVCEHGDDTNRCETVLWHMQKQHIAYVYTFH